MSKIFREFIVRIGLQTNVRKNENLKYGFSKKAFSLTFDKYVLLLSIFNS